MRKRALGQTGLQVSEISFGAWQLGNKQSWEEMSEKRAFELVDTALTKGINLFDTAPNYANGKSEELLGTALQGRRNEVVLVSKFGHLPDGREDRSVDGFWVSLRDSLRRLQTDTLDVLLLHNPPAEVYQGHDPIWKALEDARSQGMIRHYGASLDFAHELEACLKNTNAEVFEILFNVLHQDIRRALPYAREKQVGLLAKVPLDSGWLTGRFDGNTRFSGIRTRWSQEEIQRRAELIAELDWLTADGHSLPEKALAYILAYPEISCVIPGVRTTGQLESNLRAADYRMPETERKSLEEFWDNFTNYGEKLLPW